MTTGFRWPHQLRSTAAKPVGQGAPRNRYVLVRKGSSGKSVKQKTSSSSDGLIDIAAAVELGLIPSAGLPGLLLHIHRKRVLRLLRHNTVAKVKAKQATVQGNHQTAVVLRLADQALPKVIGPAYWGANKHLGVNAALKTGRAIAWIKNNIENKDSQLCKNFVGTPYEDLVGLRRSRRWWLDLFRLRQKSAE